ncbi:gephyrin-like molybdotransferase Glp [Frigoribacterium sp. CFBP 8754]|uniref:molybdopterin molybdotransferase MoeA n=1 Tax=Frigoribacterium sp. CFBP 8754 TaxID=2775290 RepID=UPI00352E16F4
MRTVEQHRHDVEALVRDALADRSPEVLRVDPALLAAQPERYRRRVLAAPLVAPIDLPPFANSQMDGFAVGAADLGGAGPVDLVVVEPIPAGRTGPRLLPGTAAPIMTGAPVPEGAVAVVPVERALPAAFPEPGTAARVVLPGDVAPGTFVRAAGSDVAAGAVLHEAGTVLTPARWGVVAAAGLATVEVLRRPRVLLVSTGEELAEPGKALAPGTIHDANGASLAAALGDVGVDVRVRRVSDDARALLAVVAAAADDVDLVVTTGGVSAGAYEVVRDAFEAAGVVFSSVAMQPGGPQGLGRLRLEGRAAALPVVCFPGNPVSALVSFEAFLRPVLQAETSAGTPRRAWSAPMAEAAESPVGKHQLRRGRLDDDGRVRFVGGPGSHLLSAHAAASLLVHLPVGVDRVQPGDEVVVWALDD